MIHDGTEVIGILASATAPEEYHGDNGDNGDADKADANADTSFGSRAETVSPGLGFRRL